MGAITLVPAALSTVTISLDSLASATYVGSSAVDVSAIDPVDVAIQVAVVCTATAPSANKRVALFLQVSFDGTDYSTGPASGTTTTDQPDLYPLGDIPTNTASTTHRKTFSVNAALGFVPPYFKLVALNDLGTALSTGCTAKYATYTGNAA